LNKTFISEIELSTNQVLIGELSTNQMLLDHPNLFKWHSAANWRDESNPRSLGKASYRERSSGQRGIERRYITTSAPGSNARRLELQRYINIVGHHFPRTQSQQWQPTP